MVGRLASRHGRYRFLDVLTPEYKEIASKNGAAQYGLFGVTTHILRIWLPDMFWATVLGPPYVALFGKERLLSAPAAIVEELAPDLIYIQLTDRFADAVEDPAGLMDRRQAFKDHVGMEAFYDPALGIEYGDLDDNPVFARAEKPYRLRPVFDFSRY